MIAWVLMSTAKYQIEYFVSFVVVVFWCLIFVPALRLPFASMFRHHNSTIMRQESDRADIIGGGVGTHGKNQSMKNGVLFECK